RRAKAEGYSSRAAYKLLEIHKKYKLFSRNSKILDCGAHPGGWSEAALALLGKDGFIAAVDLIDTVINDSRFHFFKGDISAPETLVWITSQTAAYDLVISDIAPNTIGAGDHERSLALVEVVISIAKKVGAKSLLFKLFDGAGAKGLSIALKRDYKSVRIIKPEASRKSSSELYFLCRKDRG
ncbi:MAG: RlmE family RNA methyltransferase, partial [Deferribacteraceae bacterium]|nr:RlmE family RNA methyltransferase [Deferribacteraceae bacterium]